MSTDLPSISRRLREGREARLPFGNLENFFVVTPETERVSSDRRRLRVRHIVGNSITLGGNFRNVVFGKASMIHSIANGPLYWVFESKKG